MEFVVELGLLGFWGEWHTWPRDALYAKPETERRIIEAYRRALPSKILQARYARGYAGAQTWLGFHDDLFPRDTDNGHDWSFLAGFRRAGRTQNWQRAAIGGEIELERTGNAVADWSLSTKERQALQPHYLPPPSGAARVRQFCLNDRGFWQAQPSRGDLSCFAMNGFL